MCLDFFYELLDSIDIHEVPMNFDDSLLLGQLPHPTTKVALHQANPVDARRLQSVLGAITSSTRKLTITELDLSIPRSIHTHITEAELDLVRS